jgi:hypothetical protein
MSDYKNNNPLVGFVNAPRMEVRISFTEAELRDILETKLTGKDTKRAYITVKTGEKKDKSGTYAVATVYDPNQAGQGTAQSQQYAQSQGAPAPAAANQTDDLPF